MAGHRRHLTSGLAAEYRFASLSIDRYVNGPCSGARPLPLARPEGARQLAARGSRDALLFAFDPTCGDMQRRRGVRRWRAF